MNNISGFNARTKRNLLRNDLSPIEITIANYSTDSRNKKEMKHQFCDSLLLNNFHLIPDPLKKNLADSVITSTEKQNMETHFVAKETVKPPCDQRNDFYPKLAGLTNFISNVFNTMGAIFHRRASSPVSQYYDCFESEFDGAMEKSVPWQPAKFEDQNINVRAHSVCDKNDECTSDLSSDMLADCKTAITNCEEKINKVRLLLNNHTNLNHSHSNKYTRRPKRAFFEPGSAEDSFEDAFTPEDFANIPSDPYLEHQTQLIYHNKGLSETCPMKIKTEIQEEMDVVNNIPDDKIDNLYSNHKVISSCEDKMNKIKELLQSKCNKQNNFDNTFEKSDSEAIAMKVEPNISDETVFGSELNIHDSSTKIVNKNLDCFDEVLGKFYSSSVESDDSFQIVFADTPQKCRKRIPSDCESEDSFIVFEETPDSCYVSHDVFGDEIHENDSSESELSDIEDDSGCMNTKLAHNLSRTFEDLTDDRLYDQNGQDVVDFAVKVCDGVPGDKKSGQLRTETQEMENSQPLKKVHFSTDPPKVHVMRVWAFAARQARIGHWERLALDRERFKRRIANAEVTLSWVLRPQHRTRIMFQRFMPWWNAQKRKELAEKKEEEDKKRRLEHEAGVNEETETVNDSVGGGTEIADENSSKSKIGNEIEHKLEHQTQIENFQSDLNKEHDTIKDFNCIDKVFKSEIVLREHEPNLSKGIINFDFVINDINSIENEDVIDSVVHNSCNKNKFNTNVSIINLMEEADANDNVNTKTFKADYYKKNGNIDEVDYTIKDLDNNTVAEKTDNWNSKDSKNVVNFSQTKCDNKHLMNEVIFKDSDDFYSKDLNNVTELSQIKCDNVNLIKKDICKDSEKKPDSSKLCNVINKVISKDLENKPESSLISNVINENNSKDSENKPDSTKFKDDNDVIKDINNKMHSSIINTESDIAITECNRKDLDSRDTSVTFNKDSKCAEKDINIIDT